MTDQQLPFPGQDDLDNSTEAWKLSAQAPACDPSCCTKSAHADQIVPQSFSDLRTRSVERRVNAKVIAGICFAKCLRKAAHVAEILKASSGARLSMKSEDNGALRNACINSTATRAGHTPAWRGFVLVRMRHRRYFLKEAFSTSKGHVVLLASPLCVEIKATSRRTFLLAAHLRVLRRLLLAAHIRVLRCLLLAAHLHVLRLFTISLLLLATLQKCESSVNQVPRTEGHQHPQACSGRATHRHCLLRPCASANATVNRRPNAWPCLEGVVRLADHEKTMLIQYTIHSIQHAIYSMPYTIYNTQNIRRAPGCRRKRRPYHASTP